MGKNESGREFLRRFAAEDYTKGASVIDQLPKDLADEFTRSLNDVYEALIRGRGMEQKGS